MSSVFDIIAVQMDLAWEDPETNRRRAAELVEKAEPREGSLIVLPELFATGYTMRSEDFAEPEDGPTSAFLAELAARHRAMVIGGVAIRRGNAVKPFNTAVVAGADGRILARYAKIQLFSSAGEPDAYSPGDGIVVVPWQGIGIAPLICYDLRFPELFRAATAAGAGMLVVIASWPSRRHFHWDLLLQARAIENQAFVVGVNRCGNDPEATYLGGTAVIDPLGVVRGRAGSGEIALTCRIDGAEVAVWREKFPALRDRRFDASPPMLSQNAGGTPALL